MNENKVTWLYDKKREADSQEVKEVMARIKVLMHGMTEELVYVTLINLLAHVLPQLIKPEFLDKHIESISAAVRAAHEENIHNGHTIQ